MLGSNGIVQISETGDRVSDYSLFDLDPNNGLFEVTINSVFFPIKTKCELICLGSGHLFRCEFFVYPRQRHLLD